MDVVGGDGYILNPSSLHAVLYRQRQPASTATDGDDDNDDDGDPLATGVDGQAIRLHSLRSFIDVDTTALKMECFGDLDKCRMGK